MRKVVHIITCLDDGGAEAVLYRLCTTDRLAYHYVISLRDSGKYGPLLQSGNVEVTCLEMPRGRITITGLIKLWRVLRFLRPDVVQTWMHHANVIGGIISRAVKIRRIYWGIHNSGLNKTIAKPSTIWVVRLSALLSYLVPTRIMCCAQEGLNAHRSLGYSANKLILINNGYDLDRYAVDMSARQFLRSEWGVGNRLVLGTVGRFAPVKDHKNLLDALSLLKRQGVDFCAVLVGSGMDLQNVQLATWLKDLDLTERVRLLGRRTDISAVMNALDVHVLSSASEAFPNVVAEAMACGTPAVVTDVGDAAVIVGDTGWVVPPKNAAALATALHLAHTGMQDTTAWAARRQAARQRVEDNFSLARMVQRYHEVWFS